MIGPVFIRQGKSYEYYYPLPSLMVKCCPELRHLKAIGTDCEKALIDAFMTVLSQALHLLCDLHIKDNIDAKIRGCNVDQYPAKDFWKTS